MKKIHYRQNWLSSLKSLLLSKKTFKGLSHEIEFKYFDKKNSSSKK
jgi:hypothetical protein